MLLNFKKWQSHETVWLSLVPMASILEQKLPKSTSLGSREKEWISVVFHSDILLPKLSLLIVFHLPHLLSVLGHRLILFKICKRVIT